MNSKFFAHIKQAAFVFMLSFSFFIASHFAAAQIGAEAYNATNPPFGGKILMYYLGGIQPPPLLGICPPHSVVLTTKGTIVGLTAGKLYSYFNPTSGFVLGRYINFPVITCPGAVGSALLAPNPPGTPVGPIGVTWPVFPLLFMGTSAY